MRPGEKIVFSRRLRRRAVAGRGVVGARADRRLDGRRESLPRAQADGRSACGCRARPRGRSAFVTPEHPGAQESRSRRTASNSPAESSVTARPSASSGSMPSGRGAQAGRTLFELCVSDPARPVDLGLRRRPSPTRAASGVAHGQEATTWRATLGTSIREKSREPPERLRALGFVHCDCQLRSARSRTRCRRSSSGLSAARDQRTTRNAVRAPRSRGPIRQPSSRCR